MGDMRLSDIRFLPDGTVEATVDLGPEGRRARHRLRLPGGPSMRLEEMAALFLRAALDRAGSAAPPRAEPAAGAAR